MAFDMLIGSEELRARLARDIRENQLSHAYILEGGVGFGKRTLALAVCAALACEKHRAELPCSSCPGCRKVLEGKCPDVIRVRRQPDKASIGVDDVRFIRSDVLYPPNDLNNKIYVIEEADLMTQEAQSALLLTLEEPPPYVLFLLLCQRSTALLETIRSRVPVLRLLPVPSPMIDDFLSERNPSFRSLGRQARDELLLLADGSVGRAIDLLEEKERKPLLERREIAKDYLGAVLGGRELSLMESVLRRLENAKRDALILQLEDIEVALRDLIVIKRSEGAVLRFYTDRAAAEELSERVSLTALLALFDEVEGARLQLLRNANARLVLTSLLLL